MLFSPQIPLPLEPRRPDRLDEFVASSNPAPLAAVRELLQQPDGVLFLSGPTGSGKSHLLNAMCHAARERGLAAFYIGLGRLPLEAAAGLQGLQQLDVVCIDDLHTVAGQADWEQALFHCYNEVRAARGRILVASRQPLSTLPLCLPDLHSRLTSGVRQTLNVPSDEEKLQILRQRAEHLRVEIPDEVFHYLLKRGRREVPYLLSSLERIKDAAFVAKRRITVPLAREIIKKREKEKTC